MAITSLPPDLHLNATKKDPDTHARIVKDVISSRPAPNPAEDIAKERANIDWNLKEVHEFLEGNEAKSNEILRLYQSIERDPILQTRPEHFDITQKEERELVAKRIDKMARFIEIEPYEKFRRRMQLMTVIDPSLGVRMSVNLGLFLNCIRGNGTSKQYDFWAHKKESAIIKQMYGCFGMTELAHGSNVAGCETTATFDPKTDEFIIDTPHIGATKWWIGGAAHSATHTVCYARLIIKDVDYGVKTFVVPLRDSQHNLLPGIAIGDIGAKMGRQGIDNGWIQFTEVRIPRFFMLQRWCKVDRKGNVTLPPLEQLSYISLLEGRVGMAADSYRIGARFTTIALRYAVGRRQFNKSGGPQETQLIDYTLHQRRLFPYLALTYAAAVGTDRLEVEHNQLLDNLDKGLKTNDKLLLKTTIADTKSMFVDSGSLKSTLTWEASNLIDECRQSCGGHGYSGYNAFGKTYNDWAVQCTWEGDNNVLAMAAGKAVIKTVQQVLNGKKVKNSTLEFLNAAPELAKAKKPVIRVKDHVDEPDRVLKAIASLISKTSMDLIPMSHQSWDAISAQRVVLSKLRCHYYLLETFIERLETQITAKSPARPHLEDVLKLYYVTNILGPFIGEFLRYGVISPNVAKYITYVYPQALCLKVRPYVIGLTDSFQQPDNIIHSLIGKYNGDIYNNYLSAVKSVNNPRDPKAPYSVALEDMLNRSSLDERERGEKSEKTAAILSK
ncbi:POX1 [Candida margitis]|uniref:POX1 n=1 Tax=Candida margitis TaxID=1775924 RepID=UPI002225EB0A|nr:POX1 [Candida margitis]KAI5968401.1 POX1 [Candida margitis]